MDDLSKYRNIIDRKERYLMPYLGLDFRSANKRILDFREVVIPFTKERAQFEAKRCLDCPDPPCVTACPVHNDIPGALLLISDGKLIEGSNIFRKTNNMSEVCGRVCPQEQLCEGSCVLNNEGEPVHIGALEAYAADIRINAEGKPAPVKISHSRKTAIIGAGPASLACAEQLIDAGFPVTVFESKPAPGGLLMYGIPGFKMSSKIIEDKVAYLKNKGMEFVLNTCIGRDLGIDELKSQGFEAFFVGIGAGVDSPIKLPGEDLHGVYKATDFLLRANVDFSQLPESMRSLPDVGKKVVIIGGGDTSADCVRTAKRLGAEEVVCSYRRSESEMPGGRKDRGMAKEEGVEYMFFTQPVRFIESKDGKLSGIELMRMEPGEADEKGRRRPIPIEGSNFVIESNTVVLAVGYQPYPTLAETIPGLDLERWGTIEVNRETQATNIEGIFAGGDAVNGPDLVVTAVADGRKAADSIINFLSG